MSAVASFITRNHSKMATATFLTAMSYGFLYQVVNNSSPFEDARAYWTGKEDVQASPKYQMRLTMSGRS